MSSEQDPVEIFAICLRAVEQGRASVTQCVRRYPNVEGLREMLEAAAATRRLASISLSDARKIQIRDKLAAKIKVSKAAPRRSAGQWLTLPLTFVATLLFMFIVGAVLVRPVLRSPSASATYQPTASTSVPESTDALASSMPVPQATQAAEFAVSVTLTGVVQSVTARPQGGFAALLDDGSLILVNSDTEGAKNVVAGQAITAIVTIDDNNNLIAKSATITTGNVNDAATAEATPLQTPTGCNKGSTQPVAESLAGSFGVPVSEIVGWFCKGYGFGEIARVYLLAQKGGTLTPDQIFAMLAAGKSWEQIILAAGVSPKDLAPGAVISAGKGHSKGNGNGTNKP